MTRKRIEEVKKVVVPFMVHKLKQINYEGLGEVDAKEFEKDFNEILDLAIKTLEQEPTPIRKVGKWEYVGDNCFKCTECGEVYTMNQFNAINNYCDSRFPKGCPNCGAYIYER